jgi:ribokinase
VSYLQRNNRPTLLLDFLLYKAVQCARLGIDVSMCGCIGQDSLGEDYLKQLEIEKVATPFMTRTAEKSTGVAVINVETTSGANTIVIVPGANENVLLSVDDAAHKQMVEHIKQAHVIICQNEIPLASTLSAMQIAKSGGTLSIFNPAPASRNLLDVAVVSDIVCPNESELSTLTSLKTNTEEEIAIAADCLLGLGCKVVVVTLGERGAYLATKTKKMFIRAEAVAAVDSTGAGDSFIGKAIA